jgi:hypothetical protein
MHHSAYSPNAMLLISTSLDSLWKHLAGKQFAPDPDMNLIPTDTWHLFLLHQDKHLGTKARQRLKRQ